MIILRYLVVALGVALLATALLADRWRGERDDLRAAISIAAKASDKQGRPLTFSTKGAIEAVRILGKAIDDIKVKVAQAEVADANHVIKVERQDARTVKEVDANVLAQLDRTQDSLAASRALAAQRLRQLAQARADQGGGGQAPAAPAPDAVCDAAFAASCDEVLALLAEAERNTAQLTGWQAFWAGLIGNRADDASANATEPSQ